MPAQLRSLSALALAVLASAASTASGAPCTKVVNAGGSIQAVVNTAVAGDVICVRGGVYAQNNVWVGASGTANNPLVITAYPNEFPVLDAAGMTSPDWATVFTLNGSYIHLSGFDIRNSRSVGARGVWLRGEHNIVSNTKVDNISAQGILVTGDYNTVESCTVGHAAMSNLNGAQSSPAAWPFGMGSYLNYTDNVTVKGMVLRGNTVHDCWGEGLQTFQSTGALVENNISFNNWRPNFYIVASYGAVFRNNIGYNTPNNSVGTRSDGLLLADEQLVMPVSSGNTVVNNMFFNADLVAYGWTITPGTGLRDVLIAHNTVINGALLTGAGGSSSISNANSSIRNNIIYRDDSVSIGSVPSSAGLTFSNNLWYPVRPANANGAGDVVGNDPLLSRSGATGAGQLTAAYFKLRSAASPAIGKGLRLSAVPRDFFGAVRSDPPDIGAHQFGAGSGVADAGSSVPDAGSSVPDAGSSVPDAGSSVPDAGSSVPDAGSSVPDAGSSVPDAGSGVADAGSSVPDAGSSVPDAGSGESLDAGSGESPDAGSGESPDAGSGESLDAGSGESPDAGNELYPDAGSGGVGKGSEVVPGSEPPRTDGAPALVEVVGTGCGCSQTSLPAVVAGLSLLLLRRRASRPRA